jgi:hypothetical protein
MSGLYDFKIDGNHNQKTGRRFVFIENAGQDVDLTKLALRASIYVFSRCYGKDEFNIAVNDVMRWLHVSRATAYRALNELVDHGHLLRSGDGRYGFASLTQRETLIPVGREEESQRRGRDSEIRRSPSDSELAEVLKESTDREDKRGDLQKRRRT